MKKVKEKSTIEKGINFATFELKTKLIQDIQNSKLPVTNVKYVILDIVNEIISLEQTQVAKEQREYEESLKSNSEKKEE